MSAAQNPMQKQGGPMSAATLSQLPPGIQQAMQQMKKQGGPMQQMQQNPMQQMQQNPMQQMGKQGGPMQQGGFPPYLGPMMGQQGGPMQQNPMQQGAAGGKGGMPGAGPAPNAMQQFSQQQNMAGAMQPQQSSLNSLQ